MSRVCRRVASAIAVAAVVAVAGDAAADPAGRLVTTGPCPGRARMQTALAGVVDVDGGGEWTIAIAADGGGARLTLRDRRGAVALERRLESRDCGAMARAFAVILHGFFRRLAEVRGADGPIDRPAAERTRQESAERTRQKSAERTRRESPAERTRREPPAVDATRADRPELTPRVDPSAGVVGPPPVEETAEPVGPAPTARREGPQPMFERSGPLPTVQPDGPTAAAASPDPPARRVAVRGGASRAVDRPADPPAVSAISTAPDARGPGPGLDVALAAGATMSDPAGTSAFGLLDVGWRFGRRASLRLQASSATPTVQEGGGARVQLQHTALMAGLGYQLGGRVWFRPALLAGAAAWWVDPLDLEDASRLRVQPVAAGIAAAGVRIGRSISLRAEVGLTTYLRTDRFLLMPAGEVAGEVGRSPRTALAIGAGIEWGFFH